tara:strand:- start:47 stop:565 length:519 start_codon:yes stop_codon:yes gene_type:complete
MAINSKSSISQKDILYNNIVSLSRNKIFYTKFNLIDSFQNRIYLIFLHISFIFIKIKLDKENQFYKHFSQDMFDLIFSKIELNMREIGYGDMTINKNMKLLVKNFYNILLEVENYKNKENEIKYNFLAKYLEWGNSVKNMGIIEYFDKYEAFCVDLSSDSVLKSELKFNYKY